MKQKKMILLTGVVAIMIFLVIVGWLIATAPSTNTDQTPSQQQNTSPTPNTGKQVCPEAWYDNQMPGPAEEPAGNSQYFIVNGQRVEFEELDVEWIKANCSVKEPERVY